MENKLAELQARLKIFGIIFRIGSDLFQAPDFETAAGMAVNNPATLLKFKRATLFEKRDGHSRVLAQYGQIAVNPHSDTVLQQTAMLKHVTVRPDKSCRLQRTLPEGEEARPEELQRALDALLSENGELLILQLPPPKFISNPGFELLWVLEYDTEIPGYALTSASLLLHNIGDALFCHRCCGVARRIRFRRHLSISNWIAAAVLSAAAVLLLVRVRDSVNAEFTLTSPQTTGSYAWFDGPIAECLVQDGARVTRGQVILRYDTSTMAFRLANAKSQVAEIAKEYEVESAAAFNDRTKLGQVQLIRARLESARVAVAEAQWYMDHAEVRAPAAGVLALADGRAELLVNKAVRTGDKLFEIYSGRGSLPKFPSTNGRAPFCWER